jgi:hypothetical protein
LPLSPTTSCNKLQQFERQHISLAGHIYHWFASYTGFQAGQVACSGQVAAADLHYLMVLTAQSAQVVAHCQDSAQPDILNCLTQQQCTCHVIVYEYALTAAVSPTPLLPGPLAAAVAKARWKAAPARLMPQLPMRFMMEVCATTTITTITAAAAGKMKEKILRESSYMWVQSPSQMV